MRRRGSSTPCLARACREAERAEDAVARVDQVVALEAEQLVEFRDEHPVDLAGQLRGAARLWSTPSYRRMVACMCCSLGDSCQGREHGCTPCSARVAWNSRKEDANPSAASKANRRACTSAVEIPPKDGEHAGRRRAGVFSAP